MKKIIFASFLVLMMAGSTFAATAVTLSLTPPKGFVSSNNVAFGYVSTATGTTTDKYAIATKHATGDKIYGTTSASGTIYFSASDTTHALVTGDVPSAPTTSTDSAVTGGAGSWVSM